jgi:hypothetical protein
MTAMLGLAQAGRAQRLDARAGDQARDCGGRTSCAPMSLSCSVC